MYREIIAPLQQWLLRQGKCLGCGRSLDEGEKEYAEEGGILITCPCSRVFVYQPETGSYQPVVFESNIE